MVEVRSAVTQHTVTSETFEKYAIDSVDDALSKQAGVVMRAGELYTLPLLLASIRNKLRLMPQWGELIAGCFLATLPIVIVFVLFQKNLIRGILGGAIKE